MPVLELIYLGCNLDCKDRVLMLVPQRACRIPMGRRVIWDPELYLCVGTVIQVLPRAQNSFLELAGGSRVYVSRAILFKCEPTYSNSTSLQVSN